jgi:hypothetical protein
MLRLRHSDRMVDWWARVFGLVGIAISLATYWHGRPHLKITTKSSIVFNLPGQGESHSCIIVTIANNGGADVRVSSVSLIGGRLVGRLMRSPTMPVDIKARGGRASWCFDYWDLQAKLSDLVAKELADNTTPVPVRATIRIGSRVRSPRRAVEYVNPPGVISYKRRVTIAERARGWRRSWSRPVPALDGISMLTPDSFDARLQILNVSNGYRRTAAPTELVLTVKHADEKREVVAGYKPVPVPRIRGRRSAEIQVSFVDDSNAAPGDTFEWVLRTRRG